MKMLFIIIATVLLTTIYSCSNKKEERERVERERVEKIKRMGDSVIMTKFLNGDTALRNYAEERAIPLVDDILSGLRFVFFQVSGRFATKNEIQISFCVLERIWGPDTLANIIYKNNGYPDVWEGAESVIAWSRFINNLIKVLPHGTQVALKKIVLKRMEDPFWVSIYATKKEIKKMIKKRVFGAEKTKRFLNP